MLNVVICSWCCADKEVLTMFVDSVIVFSCDVCSTFALLCQGKRFKSRTPKNRRHSPPKREKHLSAVSCAILSGKILGKDATSRRRLKGSMFLISG